MPVEFQVGIKQASGNHQNDPAAPVSCYHDNVIDKDGNLSAVDILQNRIIRVDRKSE